MIHKISEKAIMYAILNNYIKQEQYDEYVYALEIILNILITDITMIFYSGSYIKSCVNIAEGIISQHR